MRFGLCSVRFTTSFLTETVGGDFSCLFLVCFEEKLPLSSVYSPDPYTDMSDLTSPQAFPT